MQINWSAVDGVLGLILLIVIVWVALRLVKRIVIGLILAVLILAVFFARQLGYLDFGF